MTTVISATDLKNRSSEILNEVHFKRTEVTVERHGKPIAKLVPVSDELARRARIEQALKETFGILPDFPDVTKYRRSRKRTVSL